MNRLGFPHTSVEMWQKRNRLNDFKKQRPLFEQLMNMTRNCMRLNPHLHNDVKGAIACETIDPSTLSPLNDYTFHTHPHGDIDYPSEKDKETTLNLKKSWILIGLPTRNKVVVYHKDDNFERKVAEF